MTTRPNRMDAFRAALLAAAPLAWGALSATANAAPIPTQATTIPAIVAAHTANYIGPAPADQVLHLVVSLPLRDQAGLRALVTDIYNRASPNYHRYLTVNQFAGRFGPTPEDYGAVAAYFAQQGLAVRAAAPNHYIIDVDGKVADIERVFNVSLGLYRHPSENRNFMSPDRLPSLDMATPIQQVIGLDDYVRPYAKFTHARMQRNSGGSGPGGALIGSDIRAAYYPTLTLAGSGQSVGLMELSGVNLADVRNFFARGYGPANSVPIQRIQTDSLPVTCSGGCDDTEQALDIEYTISMAPGLSSVRVYVGSSAEDVLNAMAADNISKVLSTSWGWNENFATDDGIFLEFASQGQTNLTASGDYSSLAASGPWPEEDRNIVAVGGTRLATATPGGAWASETAWSSSAGGPSLDTSILIEAYQKRYVTAQNGASETVRNVPDIAANAYEDMEICSDGDCAGGWGGTSFASPIWAGYIALANQQALADGYAEVGFINPRIYEIGHNVNYPKWFHDITSGNNGIYYCKPSYDMVTGLGSPNGQWLINQIIK